MQDLISVIIPTSGNRPALLFRAIESTRSDIFNVEVIVVVNGPEASAFDLPNSTPSVNVNVLRTPERGVSNARNIGLSAAAGGWIRFLDDDDYLIPGVAERQYELALSSNSDVVSARISILDQGGHVHDTSPNPSSDDPYCDLLATRLPVVPLAHVYKTSAIKHLRWDTGMDLSEDTDWIHQVARGHELTWTHMNDVVGYWYQHATTKRLTSPFNNNHGMVVRAESILETLRQLESSSRVTPDRRSAAALGLWTSAHVAFYLSPVYWSKIVQTAISLDPAIRDRFTPYRNAWRLGVHPLVIDWLMIPKRFWNHLYRPILQYFRGTSHIRGF